MLRMNIVGLLQSVRKRFASMKATSLAKVIEFYEPTILRERLTQFRRQTRKSA
jgi:hypothetical protein